MMMFLINGFIGAALGYCWIRLGSKLYGEVNSAKYWAGIIAICALSYPLVSVERLLGF